MSPSICAHRGHGLSSVAFNIWDQRRRGRGCCHRWLPTGGSAKGTARKLRKESCTVPRTPAPFRRNTTAGSSPEAKLGVPTSTAAPPPTLLLTQTRWHARRIITGRGAGTSQSSIVMLYFEVLIVECLVSRTYDKSALNAKRTWWLDNRAWRQNFDCECTSNGRTPSGI